MKKKPRSRSRRAAPTLGFWYHVHLRRSPTAHWVGIVRARTANQAIAFARQKAAKFRGTNVNRWEVIQLIKGKGGG